MTETRTEGQAVAPDDTFADALRHAVAASGLGLESIQRRLAARSVEVSVSTLSYWQNGLRSPGRRRSEEVVAHLESVLGLEPRSLRVLMPPPRPRGPRSPVALPDLPGFVARREHVRRLAERVAHCRGRLLTRLSQHDVVAIGPDRRVLSLRSQLVLRADRPGIDSIGLTQFYDDASAGVPHLELCSGGRVRVRHTDVVHKATATEVDFGHVLERGETVLLEFEVTSLGPGPRDRAYELATAGGVREMALQVRFDPGDPPAWCETRVETGGVEERRRVGVNQSGHAHTVLLECPSGTVAMAWDWA